MTIVTGYVRDRNGDLLADAKVHLIRRDTGALLGSAVSGDGSEAQEGDADYASVSLLLHCNGMDGSTTFTDNSPSPLTVTAFGGAHIETDLEKFGGASAFFDGNGDYLSIPNNSTLNLATATKWTIEGWCYPLDSRQYASIIAKRAGSNPTSFMCARNNGKLLFYNGVTACTQTGSVPENAWTHFAFVFDSGNLKIFAGGVKDGEWNSLTISEVNTPVTIGRHYSSVEEAYYGYLDELRITKGVARYTSDFTPPTEPFLDLTEVAARPLGQYNIDTTYSGEVQRIVCAPDAWDPIANDLIDRIILP